MHSYDRNQSFRGWLYKITENAALDYITSQKKQGEPLPAGFEGFAVGPGGIAEFVAHQSIVNVATERVKIQVSAKEWDAYELHEIKNCPYPEIAEQLQITEATAMNYVSKVRKILTSELKKLNADGSAGERTPRYVTAKGTPADTSRSLVNQLRQRDVVNVR